MLVSPSKCPIPGQGNHPRTAVRKYWNDGLKRLTEYKNKYGHCRVLTTHPVLGSWVSKQRSNLKMGKLNPSDIHQLVTIGFNIDGHYSRWSDFYDMLVAHKLEFGHTVVSAYNEDIKTRYPSLSTWVRQERYYRKAGKLSDHCIQLLDNIGFDWDPNVTKFDRYFEELVEYREEHGHCDLPVNCKNYFRLSHWVYYLRRMWRENEGDLDNMPLNQEQYDRLMSIDFDFKAPDKDWGGFYELLTEIYRERGYVNGPVPNKGRFRGLQKWRTFQRRQAKKGRLSRERYMLLDKLGFTWDAAAVKWDNCVKDLEAMTERLGFQTAYLGLEVMDGEPFLSNEVENLPKIRENHLDLSIDMSTRDMKRLVTWFLDNKAKDAKGKIPKGWADSVHNMGYWTSADIE